MEYETLVTDYQPRTRGRVLAAIGPVLWIAISYVDPGKWAASIEGGARIGFDLSLLVLIVNCAAILCQYLSARVAIATGKNLAQICSEEYNDLTCILLGIQAEISMIVLDLTMILGTAYGLNAVLGIDLFNCVFLTGFDAILFPFLASFLGNPRAKILSICLACFVLASYGSGVLVSQSESSFSTGGILNKLTGENVYTLMSIVGANIMPHNLYLHSSIVQGEGRIDIPKEALCYDHFFATLCIFSGIFLLNSMLVNLAANVFYSSGIISLTSQDALSLLDQGFRSTLASVALIFIMFVSNQLVAVSWCLGVGRQVTTLDFFRLEIPDWLHRATIRIIAIIPALFCVWNSGAEGIFQLLIFTQVVVALLLPSSVIPLFRVASSRSIMGVYKNPLLVDFFALASFIGMLGLKIVFVIELVFGSSDWVVSLRWNIGSSVPISYIILLKVAFASLCLTLWLAITPLKSASSSVDTQALKWDGKVAVIDPSVERGPTEVSEVQHQLEKCVEKQEAALSSERFSGNHQNLRTPPPDLNLHETLLDSEINLELTTIQENTSDVTFSKASPGNPEAPATVSESAFPGSDVISKSESSLDGDLSAETKDMVEKTLKIEGDVQNEKDYEADQWKPQESIKDVSESGLSLSSDGPGSFRSVGGKNDDVGSGAGSLSRIAGLGRAARRQLSAILDEFWGQLFDFHGQVTHEAKAKKLDVLLGVDSKGDSKSSLASVKLESISKDTTGYIPSPGARGPELLRTSSFYGSSMQHIGQSNIASPLGVQQGSPMWSNQMHLIDAYVRNPSHNTLDNSERRYHSVHIPSSSDGHDQQPATIHGYDMVSYLGRMAKEKGSDYQKSQLESLKQTSVPSVKSNSIDSYTRPSGQKPQNGLRKPPGFHNIPVSVSRINSLITERPFHDISSHEPVDYNNNSPNVKKYHSLPDITGLYIPHRDSSSDKSSQRDNSMGYGQSISRPARGQMSSSASSWVGTALGFNEFSPPKVCSDAFSLQYNSGSGAGSLWSKQPYEQFGVADKSPSKIPEAASLIEMEAKLLQSFRSCIMRLLKLEGSDWLFRQNDGADEDLIDRVAARERILYEAETRSVDRKLSTAMRIDETDLSKFMSVPDCGDGCVWRVDLILSFGVWCIHRILELSLMESRPELWGKYTYVLNRLQGIIDLAFSKPRSPMAPCFCLQLPVGYQQKSSPPVSNGSLPPPSKLGRGKFTTAAMLLDIVKDVELAISCRKGRTGTAAGDVAFPKGKENLASVLKRYKRRLSNKPVGEKAEVGHGMRKAVSLSSPPGL
ncbi:ethylene-insensitive protein 2.1 [Salvia miltiorrhiza]|uniref:ethylene-insensitive protein 2.1 n=1 Tax=Salvia miltiorrhiza TaxID=226208 RepID=UPI0025AC55C5|nr:ethylene-insensitive protein 2.1 [Salvia miltiorrhiza]XP_057779131.1 ethylene-insensitive protein 2.1 [Salvia miltiorrhiza]XP_057779132.1 ethylene-insensitive protein 2.1 [Salvia miltiorrhiza]